MSINSRTFSSARREAVSHRAVTSRGPCDPLPPSLPPRPYDPGFLSVSVELPVLDFLFKWNATVCGLRG